MTDDVEKITRIVVEVIRRLGLLDDAPGATTGFSNPPAPGDRLVLDTRLVTLATLDDSPSNVRRLVVPQGAVITPAVKDELRNRGITLEFCDDRPVNSPST